MIYNITEIVRNHRNSKKVLWRYGIFLIDTPFKILSYLTHLINNTIFGPLDYFRLQKIYVLPTVSPKKSNRDPKIDLTDVTFLIPLHVESIDRLVNCSIVLRYLDRFLKTNIIIYEVGRESRIDMLLKDLSSDINIEHILDTDDTAVFHRTRFLNIMLEKVKTPITANYDIDVLLAPEDYKRAADAILLSGNSLVYPYRAGNSQRRILKKGRNKLYHNLLLTDIAQNEMKVYQSYCGHCQFFNTDDYRFGGMENEHFISFGPEDQERCMRFQKMGYKVLWMDNIVYHLEHRRTNNSSSWNPYFKNNNNLFTYLCSLNKEDIIRYYKSIEYLQKYN